MTTYRSYQVATLAMVVVLAACSSPGPDTPSAPVLTPSSASASASSTTTAPPSISPAEQDLKAASEAISRFWTVLDELSKNPKQSLDELATVSRSPAIGIWRQLLTKQRVEGQVQTGESSVLSATPKKLTNSKSAVVACIDVSKVNLVDKNGKSVVSADRAPHVKYDYIVEKGTNGKFYVTSDKAVATC